MKNWPAAMQLLIVGFYVAFSMLIPTLIGLWLDNRAAREFPLLTLVGLCLGTVVMAFGVFHMLKPFLQEAKREGKQDQLNGPSRMLMKLTSDKKNKGSKQYNDE